MLALEIHQTIAFKQMHLVDEAVVHSLRAGGFSVLSPEWLPCNMIAKELMLIILSCGVWGSLFARHRILFQCDNYSIVAAINKGSSKDLLVMHLLRCL